MPDRRDALLPAAELALAVEQVAKKSGAIDTVATTGLLQVHPGAVNSIPSRVVMEIDVRDIDLQRRDDVLRQIQQQTQQVGARRDVKCSIETLNADPPATCDQAVVTAIRQACEDSGARYQEMISRAYHDSLFMALVSPTGMIFIPCRDGISHRPDEYASPEAIGQGAEILAGTLAKLAST